jgi:hypothetical protein
MKISEKINDDGNYILSIRCKDEPNPKYNVSGSGPCLICGESCWTTSDLKNSKVDGLICRYCLTNKDWKKDEFGK